MPTVFERLDVSLQGNGLSLAIAGEAGKLLTAGQQLQALVDNPPEGIAQLAASLADVALPALDVSGFAGALAGLGDVLPSDLGDATSAVNAAFDTLQVSAGVQLTGRLTVFVDGVKGIQRLLATDFTPPPDLFAETALAAAPEAGSVAPHAGRDAAAPAAGRDANSTRPRDSAATSAASPAENAATSAAQARARRLQALASSNAYFSAQPAFDPPALVEYLHRAFAGLPREQAKVRKLPFIDNLRWLLINTVRMRSMDAGQLHQHIGSTLQALAAFLSGAADWPLGATATQLQTLAAQVDLAALHTESQTLTTRLTAIAAAVANASIDAPATAADITAANTALDTLLPRLSQADAQLFAGGQVAASTRSLQRLPMDLDRQVRRVAQAIAPTHLANTFEAMVAEINTAVGAASPALVARDIGALLGDVTAALDAFDIAPLRDAMGIAITALNTAADGIEQALAGVASQVAVAFDGLDSALASVNPAPLMAQVNQAITRLSDALAQRINELFEPIRSAIATAVGAISSAVSSFDPAAIVSALEDAINSVARVLQASEVQDAIAAIHSVIETATERVNALSFAPVTGSVVVEIDAVTALLQKLQPDALGMPAKLALTGAVALLPGDLAPVTDPVENSFAQLVEAGPKPLLLQVQAQPQRLLDQVRRFSPGELVGSELGAPVAALLRELEKFQPSLLLAPVQQALAGLKADIAARANPAQAFAPLETAFNELLARVDTLNPAPLVQGLNNKLSAAVNQVVDALPADEVVAVVDDVLQSVAHASAMVAGARQALQSLQTRFGNLAEPEAALRAWFAPLRQHLAGINDISAFMPAINAINAAVERLRAQGLTNTLDAVATPLAADLATLDPARRVADLALARRAITPAALVALPNTPAKAAVQALLARFDPLAPSFARPFEGLQDWQTDLARDRAALTQLLQTWDRRLFSEHGVLNGLAQPAATAASLRQLIDEALEREVIRPLVALVTAFAQSVAAAAPVLAQIAALAQAIEDKLALLVTGPTALSGIRDGLQTLINRLRTINLNFLVDELNGVFQQVKAKLEAVGPAAVRETVQQAFDQALQALDVSQLLPADALATLDADHAAILNTLRALDPQALVVNAVQPLYDEQVLPLLEAFDITPVLNALIVRLDELKLELAAEFDKVNGAYQRMLAAVPTISLTDISLDVDIGVDIGF